METPTSVSLEARLLRLANSDVSEAGTDPPKSSLGMPAAMANTLTAGSQEPETHS